MKKFASYQRATKIRKKGLYMNNTEKQYELMNEDEEREFWTTHSTADYFKSDNIVEMDLSRLKPSTEAISLRLSTSLLNSIKRIANKNDVPYQSLIKMMLVNGVKNELRKRL
jgi:predicted DNA binding CopG/RHH family protein